MKILSFTEFVAESLKPTVDNLIMEGGAAGHMSHPFDDKSLTFGDFKAMIQSGLQGELNFEEEPTEKTDGQNLFVTIKDDQVFFARNGGQLKNPIDLNGITQMFADHPSEGVRKTFIAAANDLSSALSRLNPYLREKYFANGMNFMNMELIFSGNSNVINYDKDVIQFHGLQYTDGNGNVTGHSGPGAAKELAKILQDINAHVGKLFTIIPPQVLVLQKDQDFSEKLPYFMKKIEDLRNRYGLADHDEVSRYHEMWWREEIDKSFGDLPQDVKEGLLLRWAYDDKKTLDFRQIAKMIDAKQMEAIKQYDKIDSRKKYKENIRPFEDLFLEFGSVVLKNASNFLAASPDAEMQRLHNQIRTEAEKIKLNGDQAQILKVEAELERLARIGGIESVIPTEGLVFKYKGKVFKLTGTFAAINQLMGIIKYGR